MRARRITAGLSVLLAAAVAAAAAGCGVGAGERARSTSLLITDDYGTTSIADLDAPEIGGSDTVMRLLQRNAKVATRYGGGFVQSIDGRSGGTPGGRPTDWFYYVNGVLADKGAASTRVHDGDAIWWDRHDWGESDGTKAVVGAFPAPFTGGPDGKKLPVRVECLAGAGADAACEAVQQALTKAGVLAAKGGIQTSFTKDTLRILVGPYRGLRDDQSVRLLERGPRASGVYARPTADGRSIAVLDARGRTRRTLRAGAGLVAATVYEGGQPVWIVTGTDVAGVRAAAGLLDEGTLKNRFALAVAGGRGVRVPLVAP
jgi:hypothetical protein